jgi:anti-anti-sigma regulatory factor
MMPGGFRMEQSAQNITQRDSEMVISSGEQLTIETTAEFVQRLRKGLAEVSTVVIEFEPGVVLDLTALQVFCSACKTAKAEGKNFIHRGPPPKALLDLASAAGSERHEHCANNNISCFRQFGGMEKWES